MLLLQLFFKLALAVALTRSIIVPPVQNDSMHDVIQVSREEIKDTDLKTFKIDGIRGRRIIDAKLNISLVLNLSKKELRNETLTCLGALHQLTLNIKGESGKKGWESDPYSALETTIPGHQYLPYSMTYHRNQTQCLFQTQILNVLPQIEFLSGISTIDNWTFTVSFKYYNETDHRNKWAVSIHNLIIATDDVNCGFDENCTWIYNKDEMTLSVEGNLCEEKQCKYGVIVESVSETTLTSPGIYGSGKSCKLQMKISAMMKSVVIKLTSSNVSRILADVKMKETYVPQWEDHTFSIGRIPALFTISVHICRYLGLALAIDELNFIACDQDEGDVNITCNESEFSCSTGQCLASDMVCDGIQDCVYGEDEAVCGAVPENYICKFENGMCNWNTETVYGSKCHFYREDLSMTGAKKTSNCAQGLMTPKADFGLSFRGMNCLYNETGLLTSWIFQPLPEIANCKIRYSYYRQNLALVRLKQCDQNLKCKTIWNGKNTRKGWQRVIVNVPSSFEKFTLQLRIKPFMQYDIALDDISFTSDCFKDWAATETGINCRFDNECAWSYNREDIKVNNSGSLCQETPCYYGSIGEAVSSTTLVSPYITTDNPYCSVRFKLLKIQQPVFVLISNSNVTHILSDLKVKGNGSGLQDYTTPIGAVRGQFQISINICKSVYISTAIDDIIFENCTHKSEVKKNCSDDEFQCSTGMCIPNSFVCDKVTHCLYGEDESDLQCGKIPKNSYCDFEDDYCGWNIDVAMHSKCRFHRRNLTTTKAKKISECASKLAPTLNIEDYGLLLKGIDCMSNESAKLVSWNNSPIFYHEACKIRFSYYIEDHPNIWIEQCDVNQICRTIWKYLPDNRNVGRWYRVIKVIPFISERFTLQLNAKPFLGKDIAIDDITFSSECFHSVKDLQNVSVLTQYHNESITSVSATVNDNESEFLLTIIGAGVGSVIGIVTAFLIFTVYTRRKRTPLKDICRKTSDQSLSTSTTMIDERTTLRVGRYDSDGSIDLNTTHILPDSLAVSTISPYYEWIEQSDTMIRNIPRKKIRLTKQIGKGAFGEVYYGLLADVAHLQRELPVAVKTLPSLCSEQTKSEFFFEALTLSKFKHANIVRFLGISIDDRSIYLILELMEGGDLRTFVRTSRPKPNEPSCLTIQDLLKLSLDVAKGCMYLEQNKFIHRDIAARNCLLNERGPNRIAKIGDFGMARDVIRTNYYRKNGIAMVPVKWMPPESFMDGVFTSKTDVWAFGVTMWEIFSMGRVPYPGKSNSEVMKFVMEYGRLDKPYLCPKDVFEVMKSCWVTSSNDRPGFIQLVDTIADMGGDQSFESIITFEDFDEQTLLETNETSPLISTSTKDMDSGFGFPVVDVVMTEKQNSRKKLNSCE